MSSSFLRPRTPTLPVSFARPKSIEAQMHPAHTVPVPVLAPPADLVSSAAGNSLSVGPDGRLFVPPAATAAGGSYTHSQSPASNDWLISHGLGRRPSVDSFDSAGDQVEGDVRHIDENNLRILFSAPFSGVAYLN